MDGLGTHHFPVTCSAKAQAYVDQGMAMVYGFNHDEAIRAFEEAARLDPRCAMAFWGKALALGPNYNLDRLERAVTTRKTVDRAVRSRRRVATRARPSALAASATARRPTARSVRPARTRCERSRAALALTHRPSSPSR
jgi:hypothetical protein